MKTSKLLAFTCSLLLLAVLASGLQAQPLILANPTSMSAFPATTASTFKVIATGATAYQWQVSTDITGTAFTNLTDNTNYAGSTTATLTVASPGSLTNGYFYRCAVTDGTNAINSAAAVLNVYPTPTETPVVTLSTNTIAANDPTPITITITGLGAAGEKVRISRFADLNGNGVADIGEPLVQCFNVTDGLVAKFGGVTDPNIPGDEDTVAKQITTHISLPTSPEMGRGVGTYLIRVNSPSGKFAPVTKTLTVTAPTYSTGTYGTLSGTVTNGSTPIPYAVVALIDGSTGNFFGAAVANASGAYTLTAPNGNYKMLGISLGYVASMASAPAVTLDSTHTAVTGANFALIPATRTISANLQVNTGTPPYPTLRGVQVAFIDDTANLMVITSSDNDGNVVGAVTASASWSPDLSRYSLGALGVLQGQNNTLIDTTSASVTAGQVLLNPANTLIYGTLTDSSSTPVPLAGVGVKASDSNNSYYSATITDATGHYYLLAWSPATGTDTWYVNADNSSPIFATTYVLPPSQNVNTTATQSAYQVNLVALAVTAHLSGTATKGGVAQPGLLLALFRMDANNNYSIYVGSATTDANGNFSFGVNAGSWQIDLDNNSATSANIVGPQLNYTIPAVSPTDVTGIAYAVLPATGTISGTVTDASGAALGNTSVYGYTSTPIGGVMYSAGAQTDGTGHYSFPVINGTWNVGANGNGQFFTEQQLPVTGSATVNLQATYISQQPQNQTITVGQIANFNIQTNTPGSPSLQWQLSADNGTSWSNVPASTTYSGVTTNNLSVTTTDTSLNGYQYRCVVTYNSGANTETSTAAVLTVNASGSGTGSVITQQPQNCTVTVGQTAVFSANISPNTPGSPTFQWQVSTDSTIYNGTTWNNVPTASPYGGATNLTLTIQPTPDVMNGYLYRCVVTYNNGANTETSTDASLTVNGASTSPATFGNFTYSDDGTSITIIGFPTSVVGAVAIPSAINGKPVTGIANTAFSWCNGLTSVSIPASVTSIGNYAFYGCNGLTSVSIPASVTSIGYAAFCYCTGLTSITVDAANPSYSSSSDGVLFNKLQTTLIQCPGGKSGAYTIPSSVTSIGSQAFYSCSGLTSVTIPSSVTFIGNSVFQYCSGLTIVSVPNSVTSIGNGAFGSCSGLTTVLIPASVTFIGDQAFWGCSGLTSITVDAANPSYSSSSDGVLFDKLQTTLIQCPGGKSGAYTIPSSVTSIGNAAFYYCTGLTSVSIPSSVTSIGSWAFVGCSGLTTVSVPNSVTSIGDYAFINCSGLTSVTIPASVTSIGIQAFQSCTGLTSASFMGDAPTLGYGAFDSVASGFTVHYLNGRSGFTSPNWQGYPTQIGLPQTISFTKPADLYFGTSSPALTATASSGLGVNFAVSAGNATINGMDTLSFSSPGKVTVVASQGGNGNYLPAPPVSQTFTVLPSFYSWRQDNTLPASKNGPNDDAAGYGIPNLMAYGLAFDPKGPPPPTSGVTPGTPAVSMNGTNIRLEFVKDVNRSDIEVTTEASSDLVTWTTVPHQVVESSGSLQHCRAEQPLGANSRQFMRVRIRQLTPIP